MRSVLNDPDGKLVVNDHGPFWEGRDALPGLSYSHTDGWGVVVFSRAFAVGVDVEKSDRLLKKNHLKIAERYFHISESQWLNTKSIQDGYPKFLELWMKKEAASKLMRVSLAEMISDPLPNGFEYGPLSVIRTGYQAVLAWSNPIKN